jgi:nickel-dependent lactate racemase
MPYGKGFIHLKTPAKNLLEICIPKEPRGLANEEKEIELALRNPIKKPPLSTLLDSRDKVAIIIDDITRPTPSYKIIPAILDELPIPNENVTILVATGLHRKNTEEELKVMLGHDVLSKVRVINHDALDEKELVYVGKTSRGTELEINKLVINADKIITTGHIEPHEFAGFTGGRKSILPGVSGIDTINVNHGPKMLDHPRARIGILDGNPIHEDMVEAAKIAGVDFIVNVVLNSRKKIAKVVAGDLMEAHLEGVKFCERYACTGINQLGDIVIASSGYPSDINLYQSFKSIVAAENFVKEGGIIILLAECRDGVGSSLFYEWLKTSTSADDIIERIQMKGYCADIDHCYLLSRILRRNEIIIVSSHPSIRKINKMLMRTTRSPKSALRVALKERGEKAAIIALPYATRIIPKQIHA